MAQLIRAIPNSQLNSSYNNYAVEDFLNAKFGPNETSFQTNSYHSFVDPVTILVFKTNNRPTGC